METKEKIKAAEHDWWILITNYSSVRGRIQVKVAHDSQWSFNFIFFFYTSFNIFIFMEILRNTEYVYWKKIPYLSFSLFFSQGNYKRFIKCFKNSKYCNFFSLVKIKVFFFNKSRFSITDCSFSCLIYKESQMHFKVWQQSFLTYSWSSSTD